MLIIFRYDFVVNEEIRHIQRDVEYFGRIETIQPVHASKVGEMNVRTKSDRYPCNITGMAMVNVNSLIVVDHRKSVGNNHIKHIHAVKWNLVSALETATAPYDVTTICTNKVAVTFPKLGQTGYYVINKSGILTYESGIDVGLECRGLCYANETLVVCYARPTIHVNVFGLQGEHLKTISVDTDGNCIFTNPFYIAMCAKKQLIYVTDYDARKLISLSVDGELNTVVQDAKFKGISGVSVDSYGRVFVCTAQPATLQQIVHTHVHQLAERDDGLVYPRSITFNENTQLLYVGMWGNDSIHVYKLNTP